MVAQRRKGGRGGGAVEREGNNLPQRARRVQHVDDIGDSQGVFTRVAYAMTTGMTTRTTTGMTTRMTTRMNTGMNTGMTTGPEKERTGQGAG